MVAISVLCLAVIVLYVSIQLGKLTRQLAYLGDDLDLNELKMVTFQPFTKNEVE